MSYPLQVAVFQPIHWSGAPACTLASLHERHVPIIGGQRPATALNVGDDIANTVQPVIVAVDRHFSLVTPASRVPDVPFKLFLRARRQLPLDELRVAFNQGVGI